MADQMLSHFNEVYNCPICKEVMQEPRLILCGHTFCLGCIKELHLTGGSLNRKLICPLCMKPNIVPRDGVGGFPPNVMARQVQTAVEEVRNTMKNTYCDSCRTRMSEHVFCTSCEDSLCHQCADNHQRLFSTHQLTQDFHSVPTKKCPSHPGKLISFYCASCSKAVCSLCATKTHAEGNHVVMRLEEAKEQFLQQAKEKLESLKEERNRTSLWQDQLDRVRKKTVDNFALQKGLVESAAKKAIRVIHEQENKLQKKIKDYHDRNIERLEEREVCLKNRLDSLNSSLEVASEAARDIHLADFVDKSTELSQIVAQAMSSEVTSDDSSEMWEYVFEQGARGLDLGNIVIPGDSSATVIDELKDHPGDMLNLDLIAEVERRPQRHAFALPSPVQVLIREETSLKEKLVNRVPLLIRSHMLESGVPNQRVTLVGVALSKDNDVICASNSMKVGQIVLCTEKDQQVVYHTRKAISAFGMSGEQDCGIALDNDNHIIRLSLNGIAPGEEAECLPHKLNHKHSHIRALAFNGQGVMVVADADKNCLTGLDREWKRPFNLIGKREDAGNFSCPGGLTCGPQGEIILYDGENRRLVVFSSTPRFLRYVELNELEGVCSIACDDDGTVYIADAKQNRVVKVSMEGGGPVQEVLTARDCLNAPSCVAVRGNILAVSSVKSYSQGEIRVYEFGVPRDC